MFKQLALIAVVAYLASSEPFTLEATSNYPFQRKHLSHTKVVLDFYRNKHSLLRRHYLTSDHTTLAYQQLPLQTNHYGFTMKIKIAGLDYKLSMDTGSADFFIKGQKSPGVPKRKYKSGENYKRKQLIMIGYLDGQLKTYATKLDVDFNGFKFNAPVLVAYTAPPQFKDVEGLIGLSYPSLAVHQPTFIQTLIKEKIIDKYAFGMNLNLIQANRSFVSFGEPDTQLYQGELNYYSIKKSKQIAIAFNFLTIGTSEKMTIKKALLDTGNTCISIPRSFQQTILGQFNTRNNKCVFMVQDNVPMFSLLICRVGNFDELPTMIMSIGNQQYVIEKQYYLQKCTQNTQDSDDHAYYCDTYIESVDYPRGEMIFLGDGFFNRFYTFFDLEDEKVGISKNKQNITISQILKNQKFSYDPQDWKFLNN